MPEPSDRRILHCDLDAFYASVHIRDDPSLVGRPVVIGGSPEGRGVVAAASYEARRYGIRSAMPAARAVRLCPDVVFLKPEFARYRRESARVFAIFRETTALVQPVSIDEAYLDVTDEVVPGLSATAIARELKRRVREEVGLTLSVGVGPNRLVAKIASDYDKPDGLTVVPPRRVREFLDPQPVRRIPGVGPATAKRLAQMGVVTIRDLRLLAEEELTIRFGRHGRDLGRYARGEDERPVRVDRERKSLSAETTYAKDLRVLAEMEEELDRLAARVAAGLEKRGLSACTVTLKVRYPDFTTLTRSRTADEPLLGAGAFAAIARDLLRTTDAASRGARLLGVGASGLVNGRVEQLELFSR